MRITASVLKTSIGTYPILLALVVLWMSIGIFPLQCYETDGLQVTLGCDILYREGWTLPPVYTYEYGMQPLVTILIVSLKHLFPFLTCEQIYCLTTAAASFVFLAGCIEFAKHVTQSGRTRILVAALLLPEMYAVAMYSNSAIPSAACYIWALMFIVRKKSLISLTLLCIAVWFRLDIVTVYPVILPLLYFEGRSFWRSLCLSVCYAIAIITISMTGFLVMRAEALSTFGLFEKWNDIITPIQRFLAIFGFYSLTYAVLLPLGVWREGMHKRWKELFLVLCPILILHIVMSKFGNASKHFLYIAPFVIIAGVRALSWIESLLAQRHQFKIIASCLLALLLTISARPQRLDLPWLQDSPLNNVGTLLPINSVKIGDKSLSFGIGAGYQIITGDEYMLASGHIFYPWYIHSIKRIQKHIRKQQKDIIDKLPTSNIITLNYGIAAPSAFELISSGNHFKIEENMPEGYVYTIYNNERSLQYWRIYLTGDNDSKQLAEIIASMQERITGGETYLITEPNIYGNAHLLDEMVQAGKAQKITDNLYISTGY